jgi:three-Cys-motif partner protein
MNFQGAMGAKFMSKGDREHFDEYTTQNSVKHAILSNYLPAYLIALKRHIQRFHYVDGFAGRGLYAQKYAGSPLLALDEIHKVGFASKSAISLVEDIPAFYQELVSHVDRAASRNRLMYEPLILHGQFRDHVDKILSHPIYDASTQIGTFCFVDPCGIEGVRLEDLVKFLQLPFGELLLFFNYAGFNRILGGIEAGTATKEIAAAMLGSSDRVNLLMEALSDEIDSKNRETIVRDQLIAALRHDARTEFFVPFRFETRGAERTSHYLVHCSNNSLAFKIMKSVMWKLGRDDTDPIGKLELIRDDERGTQFSLFRQDLLQAKHAVLTRLRQGATIVGEFTDSWVRQSSDPFSAEAYKTLLLRMEESGEIEVFDHSNSIPRPRSKRLRDGKATLGDPNWLRLAKNTQLFGSS